MSVQESRRYRVSRLAIPTPLSLLVCSPFIALHSLTYAMQRVNFTFADWVAHRSTSRYARHLSGIFQCAAAHASSMASVHPCLVLCGVICTMSHLPISRLSAMSDK